MLKVLECCGLIVQVNASEWSGLRFLVRDILIKYSDTARIVMLWSGLVSK